jgi:hypothetical protein
VIICYVSNVISEYYIYKPVANKSFFSERHALGFRSGVVVRYVLPSRATVRAPALPIQAAPWAVSDNRNPLVCEYSGLLVYILFTELHELLGPGMKTATHCPASYTSNSKSYNLCKRYRMNIMIVRCVMLEINIVSHIRSLPFQDYSATDFHLETSLPSLCSVIKETLAQDS